MYYSDYFRSDEPEEYGDGNNSSEFEQWELPSCCPYRQFSPQANSNYEDYFMRQKSNAPSGPPPSFVPSKGGTQVKSTPQTKAVEPGAIRPCLYRYVYIWPRRGRGYWAYLVFIGRRSASGYRWNGRRWVYFGIDLRQIDSFQCY